MKVRPFWFIGVEDHPILTRISNFNAKSFAKYFDNSDEGIWKFFWEPSILDDLFSANSFGLDLADYDYLIGVGHLGTALAITLAYYNRESFSGSILSNLGGLGLLPSPRMLNGKRALPIQMRLRTGLYLVDTYLDVTSAGGIITDALVLFPPPKDMKLREKIMLSSATRLAEAGVSIKTFF